MKYREDRDASKKYKESYARGIENLILAKQKEAEKKRREYCKNILSDTDAYREDFKRMLGWPLVDFKANGLPNVKSEVLDELDDYSILRMHFEILDGLWLTGLYFRINGEQKRPLVIVQHGGSGTPELIAGIYENTHNYNDMLERVLKYGTDVFAPQLLLWEDTYGVPFARREVDARLKRVGSSVTAVEIYGLMRILDYFEAKDHISDFGMVGLSYGGFYTLFTAAIDTRISSAISCAYFNKRDEIPWSDWTWFKSAEMFDDAEIACLVYPRRLCIEIGKNDPAFNYIYGEESFERIKEICAEGGTDWVNFIVFDGKHEFCRDDAPIERLVGYLKKK